MTKTKPKNLHNLFILMGLILGVITGLFAPQNLINAAQITADISIRLMKLIAAPILFLSIIVSISHFQNFQHIKRLGRKIFSYTLLTTLLAALVAHLLFVFFGDYLINTPPPTITAAPQSSPSFLNTILKLVPDNLFAAFLENNILAIVVISIVFSLCLLNLKSQEKQVILTFFSGLLNIIMQVVNMIIKFLPISVWAFITLLTQDITQNNNKSLSLVLSLTLTVISANLIQAFLVLPLLLKIKKINPIKLFSNVKEALILAFFTRSSTATLPVTLENSIDNAKINPDIARLSLPICTTINMNGCAQFILLTVYFIAAHNNQHLGTFEQVSLLFLSIIAAIGNAGVPMGCFFLASSILASRELPLTLMGSILPLYTFIDMVETSLNVWSDISVTKIIDRSEKAKSKS